MASVFWVSHLWSFCQTICRLPCQPGGIFMEALRAADTSEQDTLCGKQPDSCPRTILWYKLFFPANLFELRAGPLALLVPFAPSEVVWAPTSSQSLSSAMTCPVYVLKPPTLVRVPGLGKGGLEKSAASVLTPHLLLTPPPLWLRSLQGGQGQGRGSNKGQDTLTSLMPIWSWL